jgi:hypothetical protein
MSLKSVALLVCPAVVVLFIFMAGLYWPSERLLESAAVRPFAYRVLTWWSFNGLMALGLSATSAAVVIATVSIMAFMVALRWLAEGVGLQLGPAHIGLALAGALVPMLKGSHLYDLPTLALFTASLAALANKRWTAYGILFVLTALNRETAILLAVVYALYAGWGYGLLLQVAAFALVQIGIRAALAGLPGAALELHWVAHAVYITSRWNELVLYALLAIVLVCLAARGFEHKPRLLKVAALVVTPALVVMYFVVGFPFEFRVFHEAYPALALLALSGRG